MGDDSRSRSRSHSRTPSRMDLSVHNEVTKKHLLKLADKSVRFTQNVLLIHFWIRPFFLLLCERLHFVAPNRFENTRPQGRWTAPVQATTLLETQSPSTWTRANAALARQIGAKIFMSHSNDFLVIWSETSVYCEQSDGVKRDAYLVFLTPSIYPYHANKNKNELQQLH